MTSKASLPGKNATEQADGAQETGGGRRRKRGALPAPGSNLVEHDFSLALRGLCPLLVGAILVFAVAMPVSTAAIPDMSVFNVEYTHNQMKFRFWAEELNLVVVLASAVFGAACGVRAFSFLLVRHETTAVLSLPLSRSTLFFTRAGACLLAIVAGIGIPLVASLSVNILALNIWTGLFGQFAYVLCGLVVTALIGCVAGIVSCALAGTVAEALAFCASLLASVSVAAWGVGALMGELLVGNAFGETLIGGTDEVAPSLIEALSWMNPLLFFAEEAAAHQTFSVVHPVYVPEGGTWTLAIGWALVLVVAAALALALVRRRKGERAGIAGQCVPMTMVVALVVGLAAFGATFTLLSNLNVTAASVAAFIVFALLVVALLRGPLHGQASLRRDLAVTGSGAVVLAVVLAVIAGGGFGYSSYVPDVDDVAEVKVSYTGTPSYLASGLDAAVAGGGSYYFAVDYSYTDQDAIELVIDVHRRLVETGGAPLAANDEDFSQTVMPYDIRITYTLADGTEVLRYYDRATFAELAELAGLDASGAAQELARAAITGFLSFLDEEGQEALSSSSARLAFATGDIYLSDSLYSTPRLLNCDAATRGELLAALAEDVASQSVEDRYHPSGSCRGVLLFTLSGDTSADTFAFGLDGTLVYLTDEFEHTLAWFEEKGLASYLSVPESVEVESTTVQSYAPYDAMNAVSDPSSAYFLGYRSEVEGQFIAMQDFGTNYSTEDTDEIDELLAGCRNAYYMDGGGYLVQVKLAGSDFYTYLFLPAENAPDWLDRVAG